MRKSESTSVVTRLSPRTKLFVLDTNVLMHDPTSLFHFDEHDIYIPMATLEELDTNKKGMSEVARNARQASRFLDMIVSNAPDGIENGIDLAVGEHKEARGRLFLQTEAIDNDLPARMPPGKVDNQIIGVVKHLQDKQDKRDVILVSKDINMRIMARALGLAAEDYFNDRVLEDADLLYTGVRELAVDFWDRHGKDMESWQESGQNYFRVTGPLCSRLLVNEFVHQEGGQPFQARVTERSKKTAVLATVKDFSHQKNNVWGIVARNQEQNFALNLLMNPDIDFITLLGQAGTGKTLLTLAAGLTQTLEHKI